MSFYRKSGNFRRLKFFCQLLRQRKLNAQKVVTRTFNFRYLAMRRKLNVTFLMRKKAARKFPNLRYKLRMMPEKG